MTRPALFALLALSLSACDAPSAKGAAPEPPLAVRVVGYGEGIEVLRDDARGVTCWRSLRAGFALSCLPDSALARDGGPR